MSWSREQCEVLLDQFQTHTCLYDVKSAAYKNKHARLHALENIRTALLQIKPNVSIADIKAKLTALRTNFLNEYKKWKNSCRSGAGDEDGVEGVYKPTIWYFKQLFFLLDYMKVRSATDSLEQNAVQDVNDSQITQYNVGEDGLLHEINYEINHENVSQSSDPSSMEPTYQEDENLHHQPSTSREMPSRKRRKIQDTSEISLMREASNVLSEISSNIIKHNLINTPPQRNMDDNDSLANFIVAKLNQISSKRIRMETEENVVLSLYNAINRCNNINPN